MVESKDDYENWNKKENSKFKNIFKNIKPPVFIAFIGFLCVGYAMVSKGTVSKETFFLFLGGMTVVMIFLMKKDTEKGILPEAVAKTIAQKVLDNKRQEGIEFPFDSKIRVLPQGQLIFSDNYSSDEKSKPIRWEIGFEMSKRGFKKIGIISLHPFSGIILGIRWEQFGYSGKESKDFIVIPVKEVDSKN